VCVDRQVYWDNGCQIVAPHDKGIAKCIEENLQPWDIDVDALLKKAKSSAFCRCRHPHEPYPPFPEAQSVESGQLVDPTADVETNYFVDIQQYSFNKYV
jgi:hypothetical protein